MARKYHKRRRTNPITGQAPKSAQYKALEKEYRKLAKRADQRLVRLERYAKRPKYKEVLTFAYARAMRDIRAWSGENANRFNTKPPSNTNQLKAKINDIKYFLQAASSSIKPTKDNAVYNERGEIISGGIELTYQKRAETLNEKYKDEGLNVTWKNIGDLFNSPLYRKMLNKYKSSDQAVRIIGTLQKSERKVLNAFKDKKKINVHIEGEEPLQDAVNQALRYYRKDIKSLYKNL